ncbi:MAG: NAD(P)-binding protein [Deltaproteobacteria bacterium]|nr:NAD(P)-binding protein [Deltaproteobacteria bacterium]
MNLTPPVPTGKKVAIIGTGPAGLTAGYYLARKGHEVILFEQSSQAGGMLRHAISRKRLPKKALEEDIEEIVKAGVQIKLNSPSGDIGQILKNGFNAIFIATGTNFVGSTTSSLKKDGIEFNQENVAAVPEKEGVFQLLDAEENVIFIKGAMNLKQELTDQLELAQDSRFFMYIEEQMFSKKESELLQHFIMEHGKMPKMNQELEDLF